VSGSEIGYVEMSVARASVFAVRYSATRLLIGVRGLSDRLLHRRRHAAVRDRLSRMNRPRSVLVVCYGNVCRSPYLEGVLKRAISDIRFGSAGLVRPGQAVPQFSLAVSAQRGLDLSRFRSRALAPAIVRDVDLVVVMDADQARFIERYFGVPRKRIVIAGDLDPIPCSSRAILDPLGQPAAAFVSSFDRLDRCAATLVSVLGVKPESSSLS
jgi:protein-tyrosine phosphatase